MTFELLYFEGCPSWHNALKNLRQALKELGLKATIKLVKIGDDMQAQMRKFVGSPSIYMNGTDLWPVEQDEYHLGCRVYLTSDGLEGAPTVELISRRLREHANQATTGGSSR